MKSYLQLVWRYIKLQKRATYSLAISIFLISCLLLSTSSFITVNKAYRNINKKDNYGDFWYGFSEINKEQAMKIKYNNYVDESIVGKVEGYVKTDKKNARGNNLYLEIKAFEPEMLEDTFNIKLEKGRYPENDNEIIIETKLIRLLGNININDEVDLELLEYPVKDSFSKSKENNDIDYKNGSIEKENSILEESSMLDEEILVKGNKKYKVVGIYSENSFQNTRPLVYSRVIGYLDEYSEGDYEVYVKNAKKYVSPKALMTGEFQIINGNYENGSAYRNIDVNSFKYLLFSTLLESESQGGNVILLIILSVVTIILMSNSINISIIEKRSDILLLYKVGASLSQIKRLIMSEIVYISFISQLLSFIVLMIINEIVYKMANISDLSLLCRKANIQISILFSIILFILIILVTIVYFFNKPIDKILYNYEEFECRSIISRKNIEKSISKRLIEQNYSRFFKCTITIGVSIGLVILFINQLIMYKNKLDTIMQSNTWDVVYNRTDGHISEQEYNELANMKEVSKVYSSNNVKVISPVLIENVSKTVRSPESISNNEILAYENYMFLDIRVKAIDEEQLNIYNKNNKLNVSMDELNNNGAIIYNNMNYSSNSTNSKDNAPSEPLESGDKILIPNSEKTYNTGLYNDIRKELYEVVDKYEYSKLNINGVIKNDIFAARDVNINIPYSIYDMPYIYNEKIIVYVSDSVFKGLFKEKYNDQLLIKVNNGEFSEIEEMALAKGDSAVNYIERIKKLKENCENEAILNIIFSSVLVLIAIINILNTIISTIQLRKKILALMMAVGMDIEAVKKMIYYETFSLIKASLLVGLPISVGSTLGSQLGLIKEGNIYIDIWLFSIIIAIVLIYSITFVGMNLFLRKISDIKILNCIAEKE